MHDIITYILFIDKHKHISYNGNNGNSKGTSYKGGGSLQEVRCPKCRRLLFRVEYEKRVTVEVKCPKCNNVAVIHKRAPTEGRIV